MHSKRPDIVDTPPSKSQRKRDAQVLFKLGRDLVALTQRELAALPIEAELLQAINFAHGIKSHVARKRQLQFIAKMMRKQDLLPIREALAALQIEARQLTARHHAVESWRDRLLDGDDQVLGVLFSQHKRSDCQMLRQLIRNARKETRLGKPPAAARALFKLLREMDSVQPLPALKDKE